MSNRNSISKLLLNEFYNLSKSDMEIQINKNIERLVEVEKNENQKNEDVISDAETVENRSGEIEIENMMQRFYLSLQNFFSNSKPDSFINKNSFVPDLKTIKNNI